MLVSVETGTHDLFGHAEADLIDRNLYEWTCEVPWWATDDSLVQALTKHTYAAYQYASQRLGVILI